MQPFDNLKSAMKFTEMLPRDFPCLPKMGSKRKYYWILTMYLCSGLVVVERELKEIVKDSIIYLYFLTIVLRNVDLR